MPHSTENVTPPPITVIAATSDNNGVSEFDESVEANLRGRSVAADTVFDEPGFGRDMIFFTTFVTLIRRQQEGAKRRLSSPARVEGNTLRLPLGTDVQIGDYVEHRPPNDELRTMTVIDVIQPYTSDVSSVDDHIEVTCVDSGRVVSPEIRAPALHPTMSAALTLAQNGRMSEAILEALRIVEERVRFLTASEDSGRTLMESVFGARPPHLDITTTTGQAAEDEREGFRLLFVGAMLGLGGPYGSSETVSATLDEAMEYLAVASMLMRRLDRAESKLS